MLMHYPFLKKYLKIEKFIIISRFLNVNVILIILIEINKRIK